MEEDLVLEVIQNLKLATIITVLKQVNIINSNNNFVKINTVIVLKTKCIVTEKILNGCIKIAKELAENAIEDSSSTVQLLLIAKGLHGQRSSF